MQTPKASRTSSVTVPRRKLPSTARTARQLKIPGSDSNSVSSPNPISKTPKVKIPKVIDCKASKSPVSEDRTSRVTELEAELEQLRGELKKTKDQLTASESWKRQALQEAEEAKKQLLKMSDKLEESEQQLLEISASEDDRVQELRKISKDRDRAWQSELEAVQKQHSMDSAALASAKNDIQKLKSELIDRRESEAQALELVSKTRVQLEAADETIEMMRSNETKQTEAYNTLLLELEQSKGRIKSLEGLVSKLQVELVCNQQKNEEIEDIQKLKIELNFAKLEVGKLRSALDAAEVRYQEEYIRTTLQIRSAYEQVECIKTESCRREAELEADLKRTKAGIEESRSNLMDNNEGLNLKKLEADLLELKANLTAKETELKTLTEQNEMLEREIKKRDESVMLLEEARDAERAALMKLGYLTEEADKNSQRAARLTEELGSAEEAKTEIEAELRRIKVQADQWRKAAEVAASMLSNNDKHSDKNMSFDINYNPTIGSTKWENMDDDDDDVNDDDSSKKKNGNMLRKIGVLWKKGQK